MTRKRLGQYGLGVICVLIGAMWVYAFGFASKEAINGVRDKDWTVRTEQICKEAANARTNLANLSHIDIHNSEQLKEKADIIDKATDTLVNMVNQIEKEIPTSAKGQALVPKWLSDYRRYIQDRRDYANDFRNGLAGTFAETLKEGIPISELIGQFAQDNRMNSCIPPLDLSA